MFSVFYNKGIFTFNGFSDEAKSKINKYGPGAKHRQTRRDEAVIRTIREIGASANENGSNWVVVELDDRYKSDNYRVVDNESRIIPDKDKIEWIEIRENADSPWVTLLN